MKAVLCYLCDPVKSLRINDKPVETEFTFGTDSDKTFATNDLKSTF